MIQVTVTGGKNLQERVKQAVQDRAEEKLKDPTGSLPIISLD